MFGWRRLSVHNKLNLILRRMNDMATAADLQALADRLGKDLRRLSDDVAALKSKPGGVSEADLDPIAAQLSAAADGLESLATSIEPAPPPPPAPAPSP